MSPADPVMARLATPVPGTTVPKMRLVTPLAGVCLDCMAMTSASVFVPTDPCCRTSHAHIRTRRSTGAIRAPFLPRARASAAARLISALARMLILRIPDLQDAVVPDLQGRRVSKEARRLVGARGG